MYDGVEEEGVEKKCRFGMRHDAYNNDVHFNKAQVRMNQIRMCCCCCCAVPASKRSRRACYSTATVCR